MTRLSRRRVTVDVVAARVTRVAVDVLARVVIVASCFGFRVLRIVAEEVAGQADGDVAVLARALDRAARVVRDGEVGLRQRRWEGHAGCARGGCAEGGSVAGLAARIKAAGGAAELVHPHVPSVRILHGFQPMTFAFAVFFDLVLAAVDVSASMSVASGTFDARFSVMDLLLVFSTLR